MFFASLSPVTRDITSLTSSPISEVPPALPPKSTKQRKMSGTPPPTIITTPPPSPKPINLGTDNFIEGTGRHSRVIPSLQGSEMSTVREEIGDINEENYFNLHRSHILPDLDRRHHSYRNCVGELNACNINNNNTPMSPISMSDTTNDEYLENDIVSKNNSFNKKVWNLKFWVT